MKERVLVTGAGGFVGRALCKQLRADGCQVVGVTRHTLRHARALTLDVDEWRQADFAYPETVDWSGLVDACDAVVHLAAKVHVLPTPTLEEAAAYRTVNYESTQQLALTALQAQVKRFVFVSSIKADSNADSWESDPYGNSKLAAEQALFKLAASANLPLVVLRPPLVYGPGVGGNFRRLLQLARWRLPVPFGAIQNARSMVFVENLADALRLCLKHPAALGQTFAIADITVSTPELFCAINNALGVKPRLLAVPVTILRVVGRLLKREADLRRLLDSLVVDAQPLRTRLAWEPRVSFEAGLLSTVRDFIERHADRR